MRLLDPRFKWNPSHSVNVQDTWKRHGFKPTTEAERAERQRKLQDSNVTPITKRVRK